jgi:spore maturation protein CgeB
MLNIIYFGDSHPGSTSMHRANALKRLGHAVNVQDPHLIRKGLWASSKLEVLHFRTGYRLLQPLMLQWLRSVLANATQPDLIWVDSGELFGRKCIQLLRKMSCPVILYNVDDPTGKRDGKRFYSLLQSLRLYDLVTIVRKESETECLAMGAKHVLRVLRSYDEKAHNPFSSVSEIPQHYISDVAFIGTWMRHENRDQFLMELIRQGISVSIWGSRWNKSPYWDQLKPYYKGGPLTGTDYVAAIQGARICLGLLSKGNRDLHTQRSLEVPYAGGLFCAERTSEHLELYKEGEEAVFWSDVNECAEVCKKLLQNDELREKIRLGGMKKVREIKTGNEDVCRRILSELEIVRSELLMPNMKPSLVKEPVPIINNI